MSKPATYPNCFLPTEVMDDMTETCTCLPGECEHGHHMEPWWEFCKWCAKEEDES